ncbi:MAG: TIGR02996 domain-containing protein [Myxococcales bacterium]|nr:TIGR02996 domain-containing protein [Myxococcales bacterium]
MADDLLLSLEAARSALDQKEHAVALRALLEAWRAHRSPRVADLVDRVSAVVTASHAFPKTRSVKERTAAVLAGLEKKDALEVGAILAQPWPGKWQDAGPVLDAVCAQPADPRVAFALARLIDAAPYDTYRTDGFWRQVLGRLVLLGDARTIPILESARERPRSTYFRDIKVAIGATIEKLRGRGDAPLSDPAVALVAAIESHFAGDVRRAVDKERGEAQLLAEIHAHPDDLALRQVYADYLVERGDPRGEHIALGLARREGRADATVLRKEAAIAKKNGAAWIGALDRVLAKDGRVFDCGFLREATLELVSKRDYRTPTALPEALRDPALSTVERLDFGSAASNPKLFVEILALPTLAHLTGLVGLESEAVATLGDLPPRPRVRAIDVGALGPPAQAVLLAGEALPNLVDLALEVGGELDWLLASPLARRLERLVVRSYEWPLGAVRDAVERHALPLRELVFTERRHLRSAWWWSFSRDDERRFTRLTGRSAGPSSIPSSFDFERALQQVPDDSLTAFEVPDHDTCNWDSGDIARAERQLERFPRARIRVAWRRPPRLEAPAGRPVRVSLTGTGLAQGERLDAVLDVVRSPPFSLVLDAYAEGGRGHHAIEGPIPALAARVFEKRSPTTLHLYREGARETAHVALAPGGALLEVTSAVEDDPGALKAHRAGIVALVNVAGDVQGGGVSFEGRHSNIPCRVLSHLDVLRHVNVFGPTWLELFPVPELRALVGREGLPELEVVTAARAALLVIGRHHGDVPDASQLAALERALAEILDRTYPAVRGYRLFEVVAERLGAWFAREGYVAVDGDPIDRLLGNRIFRSEQRTGARRLECEFLHRLAETKLRISVGEEGGAGRYLQGPEGMDFAARDMASLEASFTTIERVLEEELPTWFEAPARGRRR